MPDTTLQTGDAPDRLTELCDELADLRDISGRLARFEDVPEAEIDAFMARKDALIGRIRRIEGEVPS